MSNGVIPSVGFPTRTTPLQGNENLIRQNSLNDSSAAPKEQMIPVSLILDYVQANLNVNGDFQVITGSVNPPNNLSNVFYQNTNTEDYFIIDSNGTSYNLSSNNKNAVSGVVNGNTLTISLNDNSSFNIDISTLVAQGNARITGGNAVNDILTLVRDDNTSIAISLDGLGYIDEETITILNKQGNSLNYTDENGNVNSIDLSEYQNNGRVVTGQYVDGDLILTRDDNTTISISMPIGSGGQETLTSLVISGNNLVYTDENENSNIIAIPVGNNEVISTSGDFLYRATATGVTYNYNNNKGQIIIPDGEHLAYGRINGDTSNLNNGTYTFTIQHGGNVLGSTGLNSGINLFYPPVHIGLLDRTIDTQSGGDTSGASSTTGYQYNQGSVAKNREIISVNNDTIEIIIENIPFNEFSIIFNF